MMSQAQGIGMTSRRTRERLVSRLRQEGIGDERVLEAVARTPRHLFVEEALATRAYEDTALPIGKGQTISQPFVVARMTEALLRDRVPRKVLELGTGSGYQAAILAQLVPEVFTIERIEALLSQARQRFRKMRLHNIRARHGDGSEGWPEQAPFEGIIITAATDEIPARLYEQLADGGALVGPVGRHPGFQELICIRRDGEDYRSESLGGVSFVPLRPGVE